MARPREFDEGRVVELARETFHHHGYTATSIDQLSQATGLNRSSLYSAFGDKHGLFMRSFTEYCQENSVLIEQELSGDNAGALGRVRAHFDQKTGDPGASRRGCLLAKSAAELAADDPEVARMAKEFYARYELALTHCVSAAQAAGDLRADINPKSAGAMLLAVLRGIEALGRTGHSKRALRQIADTALASLAAPSAAA